MTKQITKEIIQAGVRNKNGRTYSYEVVQEMMIKINSKQIIGEPMDCVNARPFGEALIVDLTKASHIVSNAHINEENWLVADVTILNTPMGNIIEKIIDQGEFRPRGTCELDSDGNVCNYTLVSIDFTLNPA